MLFRSGNKGVAALDVARDLQELFADNVRLAQDCGKWQQECAARDDKISTLIAEKTDLEAAHGKIKQSLAELLK